MKRSTKAIAMGFVACLILVLMVTSGCQYLAKKAVEKTTGVEVETEEEKPLKKVDTSDIPDELIYPDSKAKSRIKITIPEGESVHVTFETSDEADEVEKYYDEEPASAGWSQGMKMEQEVVTYSFSKDKSWASVSISEEDGNIEIVVQYVKEMKQ